MAYKGKFQPKNPKKYIGDPSKVIFRSLWELRVMKEFDTNKNVKRWCSEEIVIPYKSPIDGRIHRYYPDIYVEYIDKDGKFIKKLIEIKPYAQTIPPNKQKVSKKDGTIKKAYLEEVRTWGINSAKWEAAEAYCKKKGWIFEKLTERGIFK